MLSEQVFIRSTYCEAGCECVEVAVDVAQRYGKVRDSKQLTVVVKFRCDSWEVFLQGVKNRDL